MEISTSRFGNIIVDREKIISFPDGIPGFEDLKQYVFLAEENLKLAEDNLFFNWLQAVSDPAVAFLVINPYAFFSDYSFDLSEGDVSALKLRGPEDVGVFTIVTILENDVAKITANLLAPVVINTRLKQARQVILTGSGYSTKHRLFKASDITQNETENIC